MNLPSLAIGIAKIDKIVQTPNFFTHFFRFFSFQVVFSDTGKVDIPDLTGCRDENAGSGLGIS